MEFLPNSTDPSKLAAHYHSLINRVTCEGKPGLQPQVMEDSQFILQADMAMLAMGFTYPEENTVFKQLKIGQNNRTLLERDPGGRAGKGIYVCGDAVTGKAVGVAD